MPSTGSKSLSLKTLAAVILAVMVGTPASAQPPAGPPSSSASSVAASQAGDAVDEDRIASAFTDLPLTFVGNTGQTDPRVRYHAQGSDYAFYFTPEQVVLSLSEETPAGSHAIPRTSVLAMQFVGADDGVRLEAQGPTNARINYLRGNDPGQWRTGLTGYSEIVYDDLWPGVDLRLRGEGGQLKYEFHLEPGTDPGVIGLDYAGANSLQVDGDGALLVRTALGTLEDAAPVSYQEIDGARVPVESSYRLTGGTAYGFDVGAHRPDHKLVIDPGLDYSTFVGGASADRAEAVTVDADGNAIVVGSTQSTDFPTTVGAVDRTFSGGVMDAFVTKLNADGSGLVYSTYLGGTPTPTRRGNTEQTETARGVAVDAAGNAYITGQTSSGDFPITSGAFQPTLNVGEQTATDGFVTKLGPAGALQYSTFLGGAGSDDGRSITVDAGGNAYVGGSTFSADFPVTSGAFDTGFGGGEDVFVTKLNATGSALAYSTYLGGAENELSAGIAVDSGGNAYIAGSTRSTEFPTTAGSFQPTHSGGGFADLFEVFVTKLNPTGAGLAWSTFLGGTRVDRAAGLDIDSAGNAYVTGGTQSPEFPTTAGAFDTSFDSTSESFAAKLAADGAALHYSTYLGTASAGAIAVDSGNNAWLGDRAEAGATTTADALQASNAGSGDAYIAQLNDSGSALLYGTYLGGSDNEFASGIALDPAENIYVAGTTLSSDFPTTPGAFDRLWAGDTSIFWGDAFVAKLGNGATAPPPADTTAPTVSISAPAAGATVTGSITVSASASDNAGVSEVRFFADAALIGTDTTAPYAITWDTTTAANGSRILTAVAVDGAGNTGNSDPVAITVDNSAPATTTSTFSGRVDKNQTVSQTVSSGAGTVTFNLNWTESRVDLDLRVTGPSGNQVYFDGSNARPKTGSFTATVSGDYRFSLISNTNRRTDYTLSVTHPVNSPQTPADTTPPTVSISSPAAGATVSGTVTVAATASDAVGVSHVVFSVDGAEVGTDETAPYEISWDTAGSTAGDHVLEATAFDAAGNAGESDPVTVTVNNAPPPADTTAPTVSISTPAPGATVSGTITVSAAASDNVGVTEVRFFADGTPIGTDMTAPFDVAWDTTTVANGTRTLTATAVDAAGNTGNAEAVSISVDNSAPAAALASLSLNPTTVIGGNGSTGTVTLDAAAPVGGVTVALASSNTTAATVPASVTIAEGATAATFTVTTSAVTEITSSTVSATHNEVTRTATLTVTSATVTTNFSGRIEKNQTLNRTVSSGAGTVTFNLNWDESRVDLDLRVTDPSGNQVYFNGGTARPKTGSFIASIPGDYRFSIISNTDRTAEYTLAVTHPVNSP